MGVSSVSLTIASSSAWVRSSNGVSWSGRRTGFLGQVVERGFLVRYRQILPFLFSLVPRCQLVGPPLRREGGVERHGRPRSGLQPFRPVGAVRFVLVGREPLSPFSARG